jgi:ribosomal protein S18 acetylase RimI-like enzyme
MVTASPGDVTIRRAVAEDAAALAALAEQTFRATFQADNNATDMDAYCVTAFSPAVQAAQIADSSIDTLVAADHDGTLVAYAQLRPGAPEAIELDGPIELWRFYVLSTLHGRGFAPRLMDASLEAARTRGATTIWLGVWERNFRARGFYRKFDFTDVGSHTFVLGSDRQTDVIMARAV